MQVHELKRKQPKPVTPKATLTAEQEAEALRRKKKDRAGHRIDARSGTSAKVM